MDRIGATATILVVKTFVVVTLLTGLVAAADRPINTKMLERIQQRAEETHSDPVVIMKDGKIVKEWYFGKATRPCPIVKIGSAVHSASETNPVTARLYSRVPG
jgi:hypothetical protein